MVGSIVLRSSARGAGLRLSIDPIFIPPGSRNRFTIRSQLMLKLAFQRPHRSISTLPIDQLPSISVLTGVNGSGKTHFLRAIEAGDISIERIAPESGATKYFDWTM